MIVELRRNTLPEPVKNENTNKNEDDEELRSEPLRDLPDWPHESGENLVDERSSFVDRCTSHFIIDVHTHRMAQDEPRLMCLHARVIPSPCHP